MSDARRGWPIRRYLVGLVVLFVVAAAVAMGYGWVAADGDARTAALQDAGFGARLAATEVGGDVASVRQAVDGLAANPGIGQALATPAGCALQLDLAGGPDSGHLDLVRTDGTVVCSSRPASGSGGLGSYAGTGWWSSGARSAVTMAPAADPRTGQPAVVITQPVPGAGVVAGFVNLAVLGRVLGEGYAGPWHLTFLVTSADGTTVLTRSSDAAHWIGARAAGTPFGAGTGVGERRDVTGQLRLYQRVDVSGLGWRLYGGADPTTALAAAHRLAVREILIIGSGLLVSLLGALVVHRRVTGPIGRLAAAVHGAADSAVDGAPRPQPIVPPARGPAEVAGLANELAGLMAAVERELGARRVAEQTAIAAQLSYREVFDHNPFPMIVVDTETLAVLEVNDAAVAHYGYARAEFLALTLTDLRLPEDVPALRYALDHGVETVGGGSPVRHVRRDGSVIDVVVTSHVLSFQGRPAWCAVIEDVTDKENSERRLRLAQRMESLGQLAGGIAHDFNNLLGVISGYTGFAVDDLGEAARSDPRWQALRDDLTQVLKATDRAAGLTRRLLSFARREVTRPQAVDLNTVVADVEQMLHRTIGDDITLHAQLSPHLPAVTADPGQLEQVLLNLAVNARDAMPTGGTLAVETDVVSGGYVRLRVSDTGTGMSPDTIERAFEPFFTTKPTGQGTGLGLATVYGIITTAGGQVLLHSTPGVGTTVTVLLPAAAADTAAERAPADASSGHAGTGRGETVLVVEDEDALRVLTERVLIRHGYTVLAAANGPAALRIADEHPGPIDLLVTDVVMPDMPGHHLATRLQQTRPGLPVIYVSGYAEPILAAQKTLPPDVTLLNKPVPEHTLLAAIRDTLDNAHTGSVAGTASPE